MEGNLHLMNTKQAAKALGVCPETVRRMVEAKEVPFYRVRRGYRFLLADLLQATRHEPQPDGAKQ